MVPKKHPEPAKAQSPKPRAQSPKPKAYFGGCACEAVGGFGIFFFEGFLGGSVSSTTVFFGGAAAAFACNALTWPRKRSISASSIQSASRFGRPGLAACSRTN